MEILISESEEGQETFKVFYKNEHFFKKDFRYI